MKKQKRNETPKHSVINIYFITSYKHGGKKTATAYIYVGTEGHRKIINMWGRNRGK